MGSTECQQQVCAINIKELTDCHHRYDVSISSEYIFILKYTYSISADEFCRKLLFIQNYFWSNGAILFLDSNVYSCYYTS